MTLLLDCLVERFCTNPQASKKRKQTIQGILGIGQGSLVGASYVCAFWGDQVQLDRFLQMYAVERAKLEAQRNGFRCNEQALQDGSIKLQIFEGSYCQLRGQ